MILTSNMPIHFSIEQNKSELFDWSYMYELMFYLKEECFILLDGNAFEINVSNWLNCLHWYLYIFCLSKTQNLIHVN